MNIIKSRCLILFILIAGISACGEQKEDISDKEEPFKKAVNVPEFSADSAYQYIQKQVNFGPRVPNTRPHTETGNYLIEKLKSYGATVIEQQFEAEAYDGTRLYLRNIIASFQPEKSKRILLAAHWDTRPFADKDDENTSEPIAGANDGGSGVGVLLEIARVISQNEGPDVGIDIILFDGEDYGAPDASKGTLQGPSDQTWCLGSQYWSRNKHQANYVAYYGILLDMVGAKNSTFFREGVSMQYAPKIVERVWDTAHRLGYGSFFSYQTAGQLVDDHLFVNSIAKIPMIDIVHFRPEAGFGDYHHTHEDNMDLVDKTVLKAVGETVLHVVYNE